MKFETKPKDDSQIVAFICLLTKGTYKKCSQNLLEVLKFVYKQPQMFTILLSNEKHARHLEQRHP